MGYNIEMSINMLKERKFSEISTNITDIANFYNCNNLYTISEEDGTTKILRYHVIFVIHFSVENFINCVKFIKVMKKNNSICIECIYNDNIHKLIYATSYYLTNVDKDTAKKYNQFINEKKFNENESILLQNFIL